MKRHSKYLALTIAVCIACLLQIAGFIRYLHRLPEDTVGIVLYIITIIAFAISALGLFIQWRKEKSRT
jgi:uncharacterized membrane protein YhhN